MIDLGDTVPLGIEVRDSTGALVNATTVTLTITLPDGTTSSPSIANPPAVTGKYTHDLVATQAGRHLIRWVTTGPATAYTDAFDVQEAAPPLILSLAVAKAQLKITGTTQDELLRSYVEGVTRVVENGDGKTPGVGAVVRRTVVQWFPGSLSAEVLPIQPVISLTSAALVSTGAAITITDWVVDDGILYVKTGGSLPSSPYRLTYVAGRPVIPQNLLLAAQIILQHAWETTRPQSALAATQGGGARAQGSVATGLGFLIPYRAQTLMAPDYVLPGTA